MKNQESIELDESQEHVDFYGSFANYAFSMFPGSSRDFFFNVRKNRQARIPVHIRYHLGKGIQTSKRFVISDISREIAEQSIVWQDSGVEKLSNKHFALSRFFLPFHSLRSLSFVPLCRG